MPYFWLETHLLITALILWEDGYSKITFQFLSGNPVGRKMNCLYNLPLGLSMQASAGAF